jgi:cytochrome c-type biogenesis protein CcmH
VIAAALLLALFSASCSTAELSLDARALALNRQLICPLCPGTTIDQSSVQISKDMRRIVREKLEAGETEQQIKDYFVDRYGPFVLASPPQTGFNILAWVIPGVALVGGAIGVALILRSMRVRRPSPSAARVGSAENAGTSGADLAPYLNAVDADLDSISRRDQVDGKDDEE